LRFTAELWLLAQMYFAWSMDLATKIALAWPIVELVAIAQFSLADEHGSCFGPYEPSGITGY